MLDVEVRDCLERISRLADVMIGDGPGAIDAYNRNEGRLADGLPTTFQQMKEHAKEIRRLADEAIHAS